MKILAVEHETPGAAPSAFAPHLRDEAARVWALQQSGVLREIYFRADRAEAVLVLECADAAEAERHLATLPLVREKLIAFELIPLKPYPGFERLFAPPPQATAPARNRRG